MKKIIISISAVLLVLLLACIVYAEPHNEVPYIDNKDIRYTDAYYLTMDDITTHPGETITIKARLHSRKILNPVANQKIDFYILDSEGALWIGTAQTNRYGIATIQCTAPSEPGEYLVDTTYSKYVNVDGLAYLTVKN